MAYSVDLRKKVMEYLSAGHTQREASGVFHLSLNTVNKWSQRYQKTGKLADEKPYRTFRKLNPEKLEAYVEAHPDVYLKEIDDAFGCTDMGAQSVETTEDTTKKKTIRYREQNAERVADYEAARADIPKERPSRMWMRPGLTPICIGSMDERSEESGCSGR